MKYFKIRFKRIYRKNLLLVERVGNYSLFLKKICINFDIFIHEYYKLTFIPLKNIRNDIFDIYGW